MEMGKPIPKARAVNTEMKHLWRRKNISVKLKDRVYYAAACPVPTYVCETWSFLVEHVRRLEVSDHPCPLSIARIGSSDHVSDVKARNLVLGAGPEYIR